MRHFPVFMDTKQRRIVICGGGEIAIAKLRLVLKTEAEVVVYSKSPAGQIARWANSGTLILIDRPPTVEAFENAVLVYAASGDPDRDHQTAALAKRAGVPVNIVDNLEGSEFITPAIVDRDPVTIAIGTEGTAPVLARKIKAEIEETLPGDLGLLARIAEGFRECAATLSDGRQRRKFWTRFFFEDGPLALKKQGIAGANMALDKLLVETGKQALPNGKVFLVGAGPGDPDLLTVKARRILHDADVVIYDHMVSAQVLELARREATIVEAGRKGFSGQADINTLAVRHAKQGAQVVRLKSGDPVDSGHLGAELNALDKAGIAWEIIPGITAAVAAAANLDASVSGRDHKPANQNFPVPKSRPLKAGAI